MGFVNGFTGGVTLTLGVAYLTVLGHQRNRQNQALQLHGQTALLTSILDPTPIPSPASLAETDRTPRASLAETIKDRWNEEIEKVVRRVQGTNWDAVRDNVEDSVSRLLSGGLEKAREGIEDTEKKVSPIATEAMERSRVAAREGADRAAIGLEKAAERTMAGVERAAGGLQRGAEISKGSLDRGQPAAEHTSAGTVDAARGAVRNVINKGIEKGKEAYASLTGQEASKPPTGMAGLSDVERAFQQRYETPVEGLTIEEAFEERYTPLDRKERGMLRGL